MNDPSYKEVDSPLSEFFLQTLGYAVELLLMFGLGCKKAMDSGKVTFLSRFCGKDKVKKAKGFEGSEVTFLARFCGKIKCPQVVL